MPTKELSCGGGGMMREWACTMAMYARAQTALLFAVFITSDYCLTVGDCQDKPAVVQIQPELDSDRFVAKMIRDRERLINGLLAIVPDAEAKRTLRIRAVKSLGVLRATEAVPILILHIDVIQAAVVKKKTIGTLYPCVPALSKIGKPASRAVLKELHKPMKKLRRLALAVVLAGVEGRQVGRFMLQEEIRKAKTLKERQNLQAGLKAFLSMTANERAAEELKAEERKAEERKRKRK